MAIGDYETLAAFRFALRQFLSFSEKAAHDAGLTTTQHQALLALKGRVDGGRAMTVGHLAEQLLIAPHSAAELVARLEAADLVTRTLDSSDRRRHALAMTPKAEAVLAGLTLAHRREVRLIAPGLIETLRGIVGSTDA